MAGFFSRSDPLVLLVEDDPDVATLTERALASCAIPFRLHRVEDGAAALCFLRGDGAEGENGSRSDPPAPAVVLLDLDLPLIDGFTVLRRIRADRRTSQLPVVILTSSDNPIDVWRGYELGANAFVRKYGKWEDFSRALRRVGDFWLGANEPPP